MAKDEAAATGTQLLDRAVAVLKFLGDAGQSANLDRTMQALRQAIVDGIKLILWLKSEGYREISVLGMRRGSWVAGLIAAHDANVWKASLFLTGGGLADMVWTGRATRSIRSSLEQEIELADPRRAWTTQSRELCASSGSAGS
jgi:hypothetical protein